MDLMRRAGGEIRAIARAETPTHHRYRDNLTVIVVVTIGAQRLAGTSLQLRGA